GPPQQLRPLAPIREARRVHRPRPRLPQGVLRSSTVKARASIARGARSTQSRVKSRSVPALLGGDERSGAWGRPEPPSKKDTEVLVEEDVRVEDDRAPGHLPVAVDGSQDVLAEAGEELVVRLQV